MGNNLQPVRIEDSNSAFLEVSSFPSINLEKRMGYLLDYPHGCTEQIISAAFPQLWLKDLTGSDAGIAHTASTNVTEAINKNHFKTDGWWRNCFVARFDAIDNWVTSYAGHFIIESERKGYSIPSAFKQKWISFQKKTAQNWRFDTRYKQSANDQAYRLFTLALAGQPEKGAMNRFRESYGIPQLSRWLLAAAFATTGRSEVADNLLDVRTQEQKRSTVIIIMAVRSVTKLWYYIRSLFWKNEEQALPLWKRSVTILIIITGTVLSLSHGPLLLYEMDRGWSLEIKQSSK